MTPNTPIPPELWRQAENVLLIQQRQEREHREKEQQAWKLRKRGIPVYRLVDDLLPLRVEGKACSQTTKGIA